MAVLPLSTFCGRLARTSFDFGEGKPSKQQRREIRRLKGEIE